eukprot:scaffold5883_cov105-Isochrysis_galbana.AAC.2
MEDVAVLASAEAVTDVGSGRCLTTDGSSATGGSADPAGDSSSASDGLAAGTFACDRCGKAHGGLAALVAHWRSQHNKDGTSEPLFDHAKPVFAGHVAFCQQCGDGPFCCNLHGTRSATRCCWLLRRLGELAASCSPSTASWPELLGPPALGPADSGRRVRRGTFWLAVRAAMPQTTPTTTPLLLLPKGSARCPSQPGTSSRR